MLECYIHESQLTTSKYKPKKLLKIVFVGKGLTYDSGGLSLKTSWFYDYYESW